MGRRSQAESPAQRRTPAPVRERASAAFGGWRLGVGVLCAVLAAGFAAVARADWARGVEHTAAAMAVDGYCDPYSEYLTSADYEGAIFYRPDIDAPPARIYLVHDEGSLYVCVDGLAFGTGSTTPFLSVVVDSEHDGSPVPHADDWRFSLDEDGLASVDRGDSLLNFVPSGVTGWQAARGLNYPPGGSSPESWSAEFAIPFSLLGGLEAEKLVGIHVRHNWLRFQPDDYGWPATAYWNVPRTWKTAVIFPRPTGAGAVERDVVRFSQGLEFDFISSGPAAPGVPYDLVAGKTTLVSAALYTHGSYYGVANAECRVRGPAGEDSRPARTHPPTALRPGPTGFIADDTFDCWFPGYVLNTPGQYSFSLDFDLDGVGPIHVWLGSRRFQPTHDLNLFLWRWENLDSGNPRAQSWDLARTQSLLVGLAELERAFPLRSRMRLLGFTAPSPTGVGFHIAPGIYSCGDLSASRLPCVDARTIALSEDARARYNGSAAALDRADTGSRLEAVTAIPVGSVGSCSTGQFRLCGVFHDDDATRAVGLLVAHEVGHSIGLVEDTSPHSTGAKHSTVARITTPPFRPMADLLRQRLIGSARSLMYRTLPAKASDGILEGWEWNRARSILLGLPRPDPWTGVAPAALSTGTPMFHFVGSIDPQDVVARYSTRLVTDDSLVATPDEPNALYELALLDGSGAALSAVGFTPHFDSPDLALPASPVVLTLPYHTKSQGFVVRKNGASLYAEAFSSEPPSVSSVSATPVGDAFEIGWSSSDPDSAALRFEIFFDAPGRSPVLLASDVSAPPYTVAPDLLPATTAGSFRVVATDGLNVGEAPSPSVAIPGRPPIAAIRAPEADAPLVASAAVALAGVAFDRDGGLLSGSALQWSSSLDGQLGTGEELGVQLSPGSHTLTLTATAPSQLTGSASVAVEVAADADGDGLSDDYEASHTCLDAGASDADSDPDGDGLPSADERAAGTDPCAGDSDLDGVGDGEEQDLGGDPLDAQVQPAPPSLFLTPAVLDLGSCPTPSGVSLTVQLASPNDSWSAVADAEWLNGTGGGIGDGALAVSADCGDLPPGEHRASVRVSVDGQLLVRSAEVRLFNPYWDPDPQPDCGDGVDNDGDGAVDAADVSCASPSGPSEKGTAVCDNGSDDDGDGTLDFPFDPGCAAPDATLENPECQDGVDNDGDGGVDFDGGASLFGGLPIADADPSCATAAQGLEAVAVPALGPTALGVLAIAFAFAAAWRR